MGTRLLAAVALPFAALIAATSPAAAAAIPRHPDIACTPTVHDPANATRCPVHDGAWRYYQATMSVRVNPGPLDPGRNEINFRIQIDARAGATGVIIQGLWIVYNSGPKRWLEARMIAAGGDCRYKANGTWNYNSNYNPDFANKDTSDITRWPVINPSAPIGLLFATANCKPHLEFQFETTADDGSFLNSGGFNTYVSFY